jgi:hypothetical protein
MGYSFAQRVYQLHYVADTSIDKSLKLKTDFSSRNDAAQYISTITKNLLSHGYLAASVDSVAYDSIAATVFLYTGKKYRWGKLNIPAKYAYLFSHGDIRFSGEINGDQFGRIQQQLLDALANEGHPFATAGLDSITVSGDSLYGKLLIEEGVFYKIDSVRVYGIKLKSSFVYPYLHLTKGMGYNQQALNKINSRLQELTFADITQPWQMDMVGSGGTVNVYLKPRRSNIINALIGLAPASTQTPNSKVLISGEVNILLRNAFNAGETLGINWQQLQYQSPRLNLQFQQPYLFGSKAGIDFSFELFKKDSQFVNINLRIGVPYDFTGSKTGKVFFQQLATNVTFVDTSLVKANHQLPDLASVSSSNLGLEYEWNTTDYRRNPRRGLEFFVTGLAGIKKIKKDNSITVLKDSQDNGFNYNSLYDTVKLKTFQLKLKVQAASYFRTGRQTVLKLALNGGWYQSQNYFRNELFQIGGSKLLRGFDEESVYARNYLVATTEYRFITGRNAYFFAFCDAAAAGYKDQQYVYSHTFIGAGVGLAIETKNSVVNLSWAVGKRNDTPLNLRQSKIHLGFINYF